MLFFMFQSCQSLEDHLLTIEGTPQPYLLATGTSKEQVSSFYSLVQYWHWNNRWNSKSKGVESKALEQAVIGFNSNNVEMLHLCFILWSKRPGHLKRIHGMYPGKNLSVVSSYSGFRRHLIKIHAPIDNTCVPHETPFDHDTHCNSLLKLRNTLFFVAMSKIMKQGAMLNVDAVTAVIGIIRYHFIQLLSYYLVGF